MLINTSARMIDYLQGGSFQSHVTSLNFWEVTDNLLETMQDMDMVAMEG